MRVDWVAALAEIEAQIAKYQAVAEGIRYLLAMQRATPPPPTPLESAQSVDAVGQRVENPT